MNACIRDAVTPTDDGELIIDCAEHGEVARVQTGGTISRCAPGEAEAVDRAWAEHLARSE